jgi:hypothetical protein
VLAGGEGEKARIMTQKMSQVRNKITAITKSEKKLKGTMETNNYIVIYSGGNRST